MDKPFKGWLYKLKQNAGRASRLFSESNRRFFTLDFPDQLIYYSNAEGSSQISRPIRFQDVIRVEPMNAEALLELGACHSLSELQAAQGVAQATPPLARSDSKSSIASRRSLSSLVAWRGGAVAERFGFVLFYRQSSEEHRMQLLCSKEEATKWIAALTVAKCLGNRRAELAGAKEEVPSEEVSTESGSRSRSSSPSASRFISGN